MISLGRHNGCSSIKKTNEDKEITKEKEIEDKIEEKCDDKKLDTSLTQPPLNKKDSIEETLICEICQVKDNKFNSIIFLFIYRKFFIHNIETCIILL